MDYVPKTCMAFLVKGVIDDLQVTPHAWHLSPLTERVTDNVVLRQGGGRTLEVEKGRSQSPSPHFALVVKAPQ